MVTRLGLVLLFCAAVLGDEEREREIEAAMKRLQDLVAKAERLQEEGRHEDAKHLLEEAEALERRIHAAREKHAAKDERLAHALECLEEAEGALRKAGRPEAARAVERLAHDLRAEGKGHGEHDEVRMVKRHIEILNLARKALLEAEKKDAAGVLEHAIHARKLALEGRRDEEAMHIRETAPDDGQLTELLLYAADLWRKFGHPEQAEQVAELGRHHQARWKKGRERRPPERGELGERVHALERRIEHLEVTLKELIAHLKQREK